MILVAVDASIKNTCVAFGVDGSVLDIELFRRPSMPAGVPVKERIARYEDLVAEVCQWIDDKRGDLAVELLGIEGYASGWNVGTTIELAELGGILRFNLAPACERIYEVNTMTLKKFAGAYVGQKAGPGKTMVIAGITHEFRRTFQTDHEYDAFTVYQMMACLGGFSKPKNAIQRSAIDTVLGLSKSDPVERQQKRVERLLTEKPPF